MTVDIETIANLARLHLLPEQEAKLAKHFEQIRQYFQEIAELNIDSKLVENAQPIDKLRDDVAKKSNIGLNFSPYIEGNLFKVPKVIE